MKSFWALIMVLFTASSSMADDWPQWRGPTRDGVWQESGIITKFDAPVIQPVWRAEISAGYSGPTVASGKVYVTDRVVEPKQIERVHCFDERTGKKIWSHEYDCAYRDVGYDAGPRAAVTIHDGLAYALGTMGNLHCLDAATGKVVWQRDLNKEYNIRMPTWGISAAPLIEKDLVILHIGGEPKACLIGLDRKTGSERWRAVEDGPSYSAPIIIEQADRRVLVCYTAKTIVGLDPSTGTVHWTHPFPATRMPIGIADPVHYKDYLFFTSFFDGSLVLELQHDKLSVRKLWHRMGESEKNTDALHSIISTPLIMDDHVYGVDSYGELRCLKLSNGDRVWEDKTAVPKARWATIHLVRNGDTVWLFNERGELIIARLSPSGFDEISRSKLIEPTTEQLRQRGGVCWSHPAFANRHIFIRNDKELLCASLAAE